MTGRLVHPACHEQVHIAGVTGHTLKASKRRARVNMQMVEVNQKVEY